MPVNVKAKCSPRICSARGMMDVLEREEPVRIIALAFPPPCDGDVERCGLRAGEVEQLGGDGDGRDGGTEPHTKVVVRASEVVRVTIGRIIAVWGDEAVEDASAVCNDASGGPTRLDAKCRRSQPFALGIEDEQGRKATSVSGDGR